MNEPFVVRISAPDWPDVFCSRDLHPAAWGYDVTADPEAAFVFMPGTAAAERVLCLLSGAKPVPGIAYSIEPPCGAAITRATQPGASSSATSDDRDLAASFRAKVQASLTSVVNSGENRNRAGV
jgi:hypothetical protein